MNNREMYKRIFEKLQTSHVLDLEEFEMNKKNRGISGFRMRKSILICGILVCLILAAQCVAFAATGAGVIDNIKVSINGTELPENGIENEDGKYKVQVKDGDNVKVETKNSEVNLESECEQIEMTVDEADNVEIGVGADKAE